MALEYAGYRVLIAKEILATPGTYTTFAAVKDIKGPSAKAAQIETSSRDSQFRKYVAGMRDGGEVDFEIVFDPDLASHDPTLATSVYKDWELGRMVNYKLTFPGALVTTTTATTTCVFAAFTSSFEFMAPLENALVASVKLKINGVLTWAHVAGT